MIDSLCSAQSDEVQTRFAEARDHHNAGQYRKEVALLKRLLTRPLYPDDRMVFAGLVLSVTTRDILGSDPRAGTPEYAELHHYLAMALKAHDHGASPPARAAFARVNNVAGLRHLLQVMDGGEEVAPLPTSGVPWGWILGVAGALAFLGWMLQQG